ncbi:flagellar biosynthesis protein FliH [Sphingomonas sp. Leaf357]|uniref:FliH/SctL family protein n=1 Tax=Sphingomonas sp. Leaf357 TaxID=1736350 RepID=UPI0006F56252|nr:FliH/SctL family protein [Sphingomonas sp. Leaf357]KQS03378.1 flagellar biosynthesis protein FliH [Sphingomonas sp. Leaf357]
MSDLSPSFQAGFSARHDAAAQVLHQAFDRPSEGFAAYDLRERATRSGPVGFSPQAPNPKHFSPENPGVNPTEGWDPFDSGAAHFVDPVATAHAAGYAEGIAAALAEAGETGERDRALLMKLGEALRADDRLDREAMARQLRQTVLFLVSKLVGEIGVAPDMLANRIDAAADMLADSAESAMLRVHPDDVALLEGKLPRAVFAVGDAGVARGSFVLESASTIVEDGPELWLEQLALAIDRVAVPS